MFIERIIMNKMDGLNIVFGLLFSVVFWGRTVAQQVPIQNYSVDVNGQVQLEVNSSADKYYLLQMRNHPDSLFSLSTSMTIGQNGSTIIMEPLEAYSVDHYQVLEYSINTPLDTDGDGLDDFTEFNNMPFQSPLNAAEEQTVNNGLVNLTSFADFHSVSVSQNNAPWLPFLDDKEFLKFIIVDFESTNPKMYFINTNNFNLHADFATFIGVDHLAPTVKKGHIIYYPNVISNNGTIGTFAFNYSNNENYDFEIVQRTQELIALNMPFLTNNLSYLVSENIEEEFETHIPEYEGSRVPILFESDVYAGVDYWGLNQAEGYGYFRLMTLGEIPGPKDIVLYESLPNSLPRVGGIMTSFIQTPLSHVNLRAIQDNVPNAFIRDPLSIDTIANLLNHYIYFNVNQSGYEIREATLEEVNTWYEQHRPSTEQFPPLNLDYKAILPLDNITFEMYDGFGAKVTNVATMRTFGFAEGTIPNGFGVPFYFYQEFMKYNGFFDELTVLLKDPNFIADRDVRDAKLEEFREKMEQGSMPSWMYNSFLEMEQEFPSSTSIRCRSSTNNEDLPGFSGAGLYDSKTQHPEEGFIGKSIKQVYASLWNLRAFEEREFYRINHFQTSMGVLCHPNFNDEKVNGVAVSADPIYNTSNTFYLNSQIGEELITNPGGNHAPEEVLLKRYPTSEENYSVIRYSSFVNGDSLLMTDEQLNLLRTYLGIIHDKFAVLYHAENNNTFAMDIEYKIDSNNRLAIKQARPWVAFNVEYNDMSASKECGFLIFPNPATTYINAQCDDCEEAIIRITDLSGNLVLEKKVNQSGSEITHISIEHLRSGIYFMNGYFGNSLCGSVKFVKP